MARFAAVQPVNTMSESMELSDPGVKTLISRDDEVLQRLGLRRELRREFTKFSTLSFAIGILG